MKQSFRQSMAWLHTWSGLLVGWVLFFVFLTGTLAYVQHEITHWMRPEKTFLSQPPDTAEMMSQAVAYLDENAPGVALWGIAPPARWYQGLQVMWLDRPGPDGEEGAFGSRELDPATGAPPEEMRDTHGGEFFLELHYRLHYMPRLWGIRLVGICTMFMLVAILSGVITHKKIFKDFFAFRPGKGQRSWLDAHNVTGVLALPYHLMITYSGLVLSLFVYMPAVPLAVYGENQQPLFQEVNGSSTPPMLPEAPEAAMKPLLPMLDAAQHLSGRQANMVVIRNYGHANADVNVALLSASDIADTADMVSFSATTGERLEGNGMDVVTARPTLASARFRDLLVNLHLALFAGPFLRVLFVLSGLGGTALMGTGLLLWTKKRKAQLKHGTQAHLGIAVVDRLNVGTIVGLPIAIAAYFWGNRLLPLREEILGIHRHDLEADVMFFTWAVLLLYPIWRPLQRAWVEMLALGAFAYAFIPVLNALTTNRNLAVSLAQKDWVMAGFDLAALAVGILFGCLAWRLRRKATAPHQLPLQPEPI